MRFVKQFWFRPLYFRRFSRDEDMSGAAPGAAADGAYVGGMCAAAGGEGVDAPAHRPEGSERAPQNYAQIHMPQQDSAQEASTQGSTRKHLPESHSMHEDSMQCRTSKHLPESHSPHEASSQAPESECEHEPNAESARENALTAPLAMAGEHAMESEVGQTIAPVMPDVLTDEHDGAAGAPHKASLKQRARHERLAQRASRALDRYGYYIAVGICALMVMIGAAAGVSGYGGLDAAPTPLPSHVAGELTSDVDARQASSGGALLGGGENAAGASAGDSAAAAGDADANGGTAAPRLACWPLDGDIVMGHEMDRLVYIETMNMYATHPGVDIAGERGQVVSACHDGEITACWRESLMGNVVEIRGDDGLVTRYANLMSLELVKEGQRVSAGDAIGAIGTSAMSESLMKPHLHFEVLIEGESVPPLEHLPVRAE